MSILLLHLLSFTPLVMILGNVLPPMGLKLHHYVFGVEFLMAVLLLSFYKSGQSFLVICALIVGIQVATGSPFLPKEYIDFFFGPTILVAVVLMIRAELLNKKLMTQLKKQFIISALVPISIATLQYFDLLPYTFLNATYINYTNEDGAWIPRINGFFYHGNELVVLSFFISLILVYGRKANAGFLIMLALIGFAIITRYKSLVATSLICFLSYSIFINKRGAELIQLIPKRLFLDLGKLFLVLIIGGVVLIIYLNIERMGVPFERETLTGRGGIWNVYFKALKTYHWNQHLIGPGIGTEKLQFAFNATPEMYYPLEYNPKLDKWPHAHNPWLGYYLNAGICGILLLIFLLKNWIKSFFSKPRIGAESTFAFAIIALPFLTFGVTIYITQMSIYWICLSFALIVSFYTENMVPKR